MAGLEDSGSLFTYLTKSKSIMSIQQSLEEQKLNNVFWIPGKETPADGLTKMHSEILSVLRLLESGTYNPGMLRPLKRISLKEN